MQSRLALFLPENPQGILEVIEVQPILVRGIFGKILDLKTWKTVLP
jgi:hypothetical protein